jgi:hypothetical protein
MRRRGLERRFAAEREKVKQLEADYQKIVTEVLKCNPIPASQRSDDQLEPPWEVIARIRQQLLACEKQRDELLAALKDTTRKASSSRKYPEAEEKWYTGDLLSAPRLVDYPPPYSKQSRQAGQDLATKTDLADLKADLIKWNVGTLIAMTALFSIRQVWSY